MEDDEDAFLYGDSEPDHTTPVQTTVQPPPPSKTPEAIETVLEDDIADDADEDIEQDEADDSDSDVEFIIEQPTQSQSVSRPPLPVRAVSNQAQAPLPQSPVAQPHLTTEYTVRERGSVIPPLGIVSSPAPALALALATSSTSPSQFVASTAEQDEDATAPSATDTTLPDPSTLPPALASSSSPSIDPAAPGVFSGMPIYDIDMQALTEKNWRRPGSNISDWFNYGFDELSWEAYCVRRRDLAALGADLRGNILNLAGMSEEMLQNSVPPEMRSMLIAQASRMGLAQQGVVPPQGQVMPGFHPGFPVPGMPQQAQQAQQGGQPNGGFPMQMMHPGMAMPPEMMMNMQQPMMGVGEGSGTPQQQPQAPMGDESLQMQGMQGMDGFNVNGAGGFQGQPFADQTGASLEQMVVPTAPSPMRGGAPFAPRGRGQPARHLGGGVPLGPAAARGGGAGRGRGFDGVPQVLPKRPVSPLPSNVPTGPRNQQPRYKDRDGGSAAVELDYGGGGGSGSNSGGGGASEEREEKREKRERSPPSGPRKDKERSSRTEWKREESSSSSSRKRSLEDDHDYDASRSSKRR